MIRRLLALLVLLVGLGLLVWRFEDIREWWFLRSYQAPAEIVALADSAAMSDAGRRDFYVANPQIDDKQSFGQHCPVSELSLVLGCYNRSRIYILRVERSQLGNVMSVTAAHEMLHSVYEDLSTSERRRLNQLLDAEFKNSTDQKLRDLMAEYERAEPGERYNELHSILGTQVASLSPELEQHYARYFTNRAQVVVAFKAYEGVFEDLERQIDGLSAQITALRDQLDDLEATINSKQQELETLNAQMDRLRASGQIQDYNALVPRQNALVREYNGLVGQYKDLVALHNSKVDQLNQLALEQNELVESLDATKFNPL